MDLATVLARVEERLVRWALARSRGNLAQAAQILNIPRSTLQYKVNGMAGPIPKPLASLAAEF